MRSASQRTIFVCAAVAVLGGCAHPGRGPVLSTRLVHGTQVSDRPIPKATLAQPDWSGLRREIRAKEPANAVAQSMTLEKLYRELGDAVKAVAQAPNDGSSHLVAAMAYYGAGILDVAQDYLAEAVRLDPANGAAYDLRARIWRDWGCPATGLADAYRAVYFAPRAPEARNTLGTIFVALGNAAEARASFKRAVALDNDAAYAWINLCRTAVASGDEVGVEMACFRVPGTNAPTVSALLGAKGVRALAGDGAHEARR